MNERVAGANWGYDPHDSTQLSYHINLGMTPTHEHLQQLLYDLYLHRCQEPQYLFVAEADAIALRHQIRSEILKKRFIFDDGLCCGNYTYSNATGNKVHFVALPDLEPGSVILGFFL